MNHPFLIGRVHPNGRAHAIHAEYLDEFLCGFLPMLRVLPSAETFDRAHPRVCEDCSLIVDAYLRRGVAPGRPLDLRDQPQPEPEVEVEVEVVDASAAAEAINLRQVTGDVVASCDSCGGTPSAWPLRSQIVLICGCGWHQEATSDQLVAAGVGERVS